MIFPHHIAKIKKFVKVGIFSDLVKVGNFNKTDKVKISKFLKSLKFALNDFSVKSDFLAYKITNGYQDMTKKPTYAIIQ